MSKGNVLVTGGSGYIGSHTVVELLKEDYSAIVVDNMANAVENEQGFPESLKRVQKITGKDLTFYKLDIRNVDIIFMSNYSVLDSVLTSTDGTSDTTIPTEILGFWATGGEVIEFWNQRFENEMISV